MPIKIRDMKDEISERIGVEMPHGLVLIRFYKDGRINIGHTDSMQVSLKPNPQGVEMEWPSRES